MDRRLKELETKYAKEARETRGATMLKSLSIPQGLWPGRVPSKAEVAIHRNKDVKVAGSSFHLDALNARVAHGDHWAGYAALIPQPDNPHDRNAVGVYVAGRQVGFLPAEQASLVAGDLQRLLEMGTAVAARIKIFKTPRGIGARIKLDLPLETRSG